MKVVVGDFVEMSAVTGEAAVIRWYRNGTPKGPRVKGFSSESVDWVCSTVSKASSFKFQYPEFHTSSGFPARATKVPRRV